MILPEPKFRCPTKEAIEVLSKRFNLPNEENMQDWEWEVADSARINEFIKAYKTESLNDDEKFTLMEIIIQSFEDLNTDLNNNPNWNGILKILRTNFTLHQYTIWYWSDFVNDNNDEKWTVTDYLKKIYVSNYQNEEYVDKELIGYLNLVVDENTFINFLEKLASDRLSAETKEKESPSNPNEVGHNGWVNESIGSYLDSAKSWAKDSINGLPDQPKEVNPFKN